MDFARKYTSAYSISVLFIHKRHINKICERRSLLYIYYYYYCLAEMLRTAKKWENNIWKITLFVCVCLSLNNSMYVPLFRARSLYHPKVQCVPKRSSRVDTGNSFCVMCALLLPFNAWKPKNKLRFVVCCVVRSIQNYCSYKSLTAPKIVPLFVIVTNKCKYLRN